MRDTLRRLMDGEQISDIGFAALPDGELTFAHAVSLVVRLPDGVVDTITDEPSLDYFLLYRTVNAFLDRCALKTALALEREGFRALPVGSSHSFPDRGGFAGRYSHKKAAVLAGLGVMGRHNLFIHRDFGPRVRLATVLTDCDFGVTAPADATGDVRCSDCGLCIKHCPAGAISADGFSPAVCSGYLKEHFQHIGRGAVCGICMRVCPDKGVAR